MNFGIREWMLLFGSVLFIAVVIDGLRRVLADRREEVRLSKHARKGFPSLDDAEPKSTELLGSARVVPRNGRSVPKPSNSRGASADQVDAEVEADSDQFDIDTREYEDTVPVLLDPIPDSEFDSIVASPDQAEAFTNRRSLPAEPQLQTNLPLEEPAPEAPLTAQATAEKMGEDFGVPSGDTRAVEEVILINVHAPQGEVFDGEILLELLLEQDIRFGSMDIFHKRESRIGNSQILFSIANSVEPGVFDLDKIDTFRTPGITLFMQLPGPAKPMAAFKDMLATADSLARALGAYLLDEQRNPISQQTLEHLKQRVEDFERRSLLKPRI